MRTILALPLLLVAFLPQRAEAQSLQRFSVQVSGIGNILFGDVEAQSELNFGSPASGAGGEIQLRYSPSRFSFGLGFQLSIHGAESAPISEGSSVIQDSDQTFTLSGIFVEPRYVVTASENRAFYLSGRIALSRIDGENSVAGFDCQGDPFCRDPVLVEIMSEGSATGFTVNGGGGVLFGLSERVSLDVGATVGVKDFGDLDLAVAGQGGQETGDLGSFANVVFRVGLAIGIGR